ncbi:hypothetical protein DFR70_103177 [Nocardia tenerifensis]|uniref:WXG100 family type VII secretion target n=1 Tax=Nocardia tenerifensis TaxID=228006 RepID=A0A318K458_9NOCA|nr:hypothetical protein [Nocardia tenerifensis]PXX66429.1 hypothetical protein DFR70_103177 [Nocardia tenerifensis]
MSDNPYPNLGFNPVPGIPADVAALRGQIDTSAVAVRETNDLLSRLRNSNDDVWKGDAGDAFRADFDATLAQDLGYAQKSLERAVTLLDQWHTDLLGYQDTATRLEAEAADAKSRHAQAVAALQSAQANPDLALANVMFTDQGELQAAQARLDAATAQVRAAGTEVDNWQGKIDSVLQRAHDLETQHDGTARRAATELDSAAKDFAPSPPDKSIWDRIADAVKSVGEWIDEHREGVHQALSILAAAGGLVALVTPPPFDIIGFVVAAGATAGLLGLDLSDPAIRAGLQNGELDAWTTVGLDAMGLAPVGGAGVGAGKVGWGLLRGGSEFADGVHAAQSLSGLERIGGTVYNAVTHEPGIVSKAIGGIPGVPKVVEVLGLDRATRNVFQATGIAGDHAEVATAAEAVDLFSRSGKVVNSILDVVLPQTAGD